MIEGAEDLKTYGTLAGEMAEAEAFAERHGLAVVTLPRSTGQALQRLLDLAARSALAPLDDWKIQDEMEEFLR